MSAGSVATDSIREGGQVGRLRLAHRVIRNSRSGGPADRPSYGIVDRSLGDQSIAVLTLGERHCGITPSTLHYRGL